MQMERRAWRRLALSKNCRLTASTDATVTVRIKGYWNYWKYRIILYVSERERENESKPN